ncbi:MAG: type I-E CRISPR-associated protein Cse1/CasA [Chitinivibrionia bacterium]|nr:type I-E CRISPR-associated protein Cse1/CasA [Chitinivibrionia bacterium]
MNLIQDRWIPVRRKSGALERIAPWQVTDRHSEDPFVGLAAPRPDFNGALIQFLIGILQTTCAPLNVFEWKGKLASPPSSEELHKAFTTVAMAFDLDGDGPRFMQDLTLVNELADKESVKLANEIGQLLIEAPGVQALEKNKDLFIKRAQTKRLCPFCAATALFTLQTNAPAGGQGNRMGIRGKSSVISGGGPLTTLVLGKTLWATCWLNVLEKNDFLSSTAADARKLLQSDRFSWLAPTRTSEGGRATTPNDCHPDQVYWAMPRRIRLIFDEPPIAACDICGEKENGAESCTYLAKNLGTNFEGPWKHPLTPYFITADGTPGALHPKPGGIGYRHWLGMVVSNASGKGRKEPARTVARYLRDGEEDLQLWAFGYDMANMKARSWQESTMPLLECPAQFIGVYSTHITGLVSAADLASIELLAQVKKALFRTGAEVRGDLSFVTYRFWQETEAPFYGNVHRLRDALIAGSEVDSILVEWHRILVSHAEHIFDDLSQNGSFDAADPKRIATAWRDLRQSLHGRKMKETLGLPFEKLREKRVRARRRKDADPES